MCVCSVAQWCPTLCDPSDCILLAALSMEFSRQEYWNGLPFPTPGDSPDLGIEPTSLASPALAGKFVTTSATWEAHVTCIISFNPHYSVVRFIISYSFYKQGKQS